ncbi:DNA-binding transcriptional LysR family regulator [Paraburkholderia sp. CI2]|uniref:LysR family transcriptional regulator n=1 Tax=unclassified Paraburkholderia TaxID=2615204 RepID=UPI00160E279F|nr:MULTISPECIES: LysR family transcriptional regulator [unclassified Paraburkholderia]MBB5465934.1 DNA-binding transcriptional LysR family regulator [Paraburkholderia sp. CI2]MBC8731353.1 LysR family transcriptional regulator [Paraburkholderia sp. UCT2]
MTPTIKQLRAFALVCRFGVLTRAADEMFITQPAVSVLIRQMEEALGLRLFDRTSRSLRPTAAAHEILPTVERMLRDLESIQSSVKELAGRERGRLRFAATPSIAAAIVPKLLAEYRALYPNIEVSVDDAAPDRLTASTLTGDVEFGIGTISERPEGITLQCLARDNLCAICRKDSALAKKRRVSWKDALQYPWLGIKSTSGIRKLIDETLFTLGMRKAVEYEVSYMTTGLSMVQAGLGIAIFPGILLGSFPHRDLVARRLEAPLVTRDVNLIRRAEHSLSPAAESFIELWYKRIGKPADL